MTSPQDEPYLNALGMIGVSQPVPVVHQNFTNGVIDGVHIGASAIGSFKLHEPAEYVITNLPISSSAMFLLMNKDVYAGLSSAEKKCVDDASGLDLSLRGATRYNELFAAGVNLAKQNGVTEIRLTDAQRDEWLARMQPVVDDFLSSTVNVSQSIATANITGKQLVDAFNGLSN